MKEILNLLHHVLAGEHPAGTIFINPISSIKIHRIPSLILKRGNHEQARYSY